jgi:poly-gamma-glutamate capsule biosynthesis protein CapA/YwtB (metallophosphatase superfamily)
VSGTAAAMWRWRSYVALAEKAHGLIPRPVGFTWPWGEALGVLDEAAPDARVVNLETGITRSDDFAPGKGVHYRMNPANLPCLTAARPDVCVLANNHVMDFGRGGLEETLGALAGARLRAAGAGRDAGEARRPAVVPVDGGRRVLVFAVGMPSSGIPESWGAAPDRPGVDLVARPSGASAAEVAERVRRVRRPGDIAVVSLHWGANWGYRVRGDEIRFAHALVDGGVDVVHGHSSHHPRPLEVYRGKLVLYGCGDFIDDYEGIGGRGHYRDDLRLMYVVSVEPDTGSLRDVRITPLLARRMRLRRPPREDTEWLRAVLDRISRDFGTRVRLQPDGTLAVRAARPAGTAPTRATVGRTDHRFTA